MIEVKRWQAKDETLWLTKSDCMIREAQIDGLGFVCPKCNGTGEVQGAVTYRRERDFHAESWGAGVSYYNVPNGHEVLKCDVCSGRGYTATQVKAITKEVVVGYQ